MNMRIPKIRLHIVIIALLSFLAIFFLTSLVQAQETSPSIRNRNPGQVRPPVLINSGSSNVIKRGETFQLVDPSHKPTAVTFNQCVNAAKSSCTHGVSDVDHDEETGSCRFGCLAAPSSNSN